jgi:hypothetical protein
MRESARSIAATLPRGAYLLRVEPAAAKAQPAVFVADVQRALQRAAVRVIEAYQAAASGRISPCRFYPSCSQYAVEAFSEHGFWRGLALTARRLVRCRPFGPHGVDLVPLPVHTHDAPRVRRSR